MSELIDKNPWKALPFRDKYVVSDGEQVLFAGTKEEMEWLAKAHNDRVGKFAKDVIAPPAEKK